MSEVDVTAGGRRGHRHGHDHRPAAGSEGRLWFAIALNIVIVAAQAVVGFMAHSVGLLADAGHNLTDVAALVVAVVAVRLAARAATGRHSFGLVRGPVLAALFNAASILAVSVYVVVEALGRLRHPGPVAGPLVVIAALVGAAANGLSALILHDRHADLNMRAALWHLVADALTSVAVAAAGLAIWWRPGLAWLDPVTALVISAVIAWQGLRLLRGATEVLLEATPPGVDLDDVRRRVLTVPGVSEVHHLHAWSISEDIPALSAHLLLDGVPTLREAQEVAGEVRRRLRSELGITHATLELECHRCDEDPACSPEAIRHASAMPVGGHRH